MWENEQKLNDELMMNEGARIRDQGSGIRDQGSGSESGIRDQGSGIRDQGSGTRDQGSGSDLLWRLNRYSTGTLWTCCSALYGE